MKILALEFSSDRRGVALVDTDAIPPAHDATSESLATRFASAIAQPSTPTQCLAVASETGGRTMHAFAMIQKVLEEANCPREAVERIAVGIGPGSYTGIRAALAIAQGWHLALGTPVVGVGSVQALATEIAAGRSHDGFRIAIDAQRQEYYVAEYHLRPTGCEETGKLRLVGLDELKTLLNQGCPVFSPDSGAAQVNAAVNLAFPSAAWVGLLGSQTNSTAITSPELLEPIYLRASNFVKAPPPRILL